MAKEAYYFSHDANARSDPKILGMRSVYGSEGYGWFWILVEMMREADNYRLDLSGKYVWNAYAKQMECKCIASALHVESKSVFCGECAKQFVMDCIQEFELFASDGQYFWSNSLLKRMDKREAIREKRRNAANKRWGNNEEENQAPQGIEAFNEVAAGLADDPNGMHMHSTSNANASENDANLCKGKERKGKESKYKDIKEQQASNPANAFKFYEENFGVLSSFILQEITGWLADMEEPVLVMAMEIAIKRNKRNWSFVEGILKDWFGQGVKTLSEAEASQREFMRSKGGVKDDAGETKETGKYAEFIHE